MKTVLKNSLKPNKTLLILSLLSILLGALSCVLGEILIPITVGVLSALYLFDTKSKHLISIGVSTVLIALNAASIYMNFAITFFAPTSVILAVILYYAFVKGESKSDAAFLMSIIAAVFTALGYMVFAMSEREIYTFEAAIDYYTQLIDYIRALFVDGMLALYSASGLDVTAEAIRLVFDQQINMIISYLFIGGFAISGIGMKIFGAIAGSCSEDKTQVKEWRFGVPRLYAYGYVLLVILSLFATSGNSIFAISVLNLYNIFMVVFAYLGFKTTYENLRKRMTPFVSAIILIGVLLVFSSFATQILAAVGVLAAMRRNDFEAVSK